MEDRTRGLPATANIGFFRRDAREILAAKFAIDGVIVRMTRSVQSQRGLLETRCGVTVATSASYGLCACVIHS